MRKASMLWCLEAFIVVETTSSRFAHSCPGFEALLFFAFWKEWKYNEYFCSARNLNHVPLTGDIHPHVCFCFPNSFIILLKAQEQKVHPQQQSQYVHWQLSRTIQGGKSNWKSKILIQGIFDMKWRVGMHSPFF